MLCNLLITVLCWSVIGNVQNLLFSFSFLTVLQQSTEAQEAAILPPVQKWMRADQAKPIELSKPCGGGMFNPIAGICGQV